MERPEVLARRLLPPVVLLAVAGLALTSCGPVNPVDAMKGVNLRPLVPLFQEVLLKGKDFLFKPDSIIPIWQHLLPLVGGILGLAGKGDIKEKLLNGLVGSSIGILTGIVLDDPTRADIMAKSLLHQLSTLGKKIAPEIIGSLFTPVSFLLKKYHRHETYSLKDLEIDLLKSGGLWFGSKWLMS